MRPTSSPATSRTFLPRRSSTLVSILLLLLLVSAARNSLDDVAGDPDFPINRSGLLRLDVQLDLLAGCHHARPRDSDRAIALRTPQFGKLNRQSGKGRMQTCPQRPSPDLDVGNARLRILSELHHQPVNPTHLTVLAVNKFLIEDVAYKVHCQPPMIWSGIEITARTNEIRMMIATTELLIQPLRWSPR